VNISNNTISENLGVASSDGSTSAGVLVSTLFGSGTEATVSNNFISNNTTGVFVGFNASDASTVTVNNNSITGNDNGVVSTAQNVDATCNWWGSIVYDDIALLTNGPVTFNPALLGGTDAMPATTGFQPADNCGNTDSVAPDAVCQNINLYLNAAGQAQIADPADLDGGSTDNAGIASFAVSMTNFDCSHLGVNNVTLTVMDINGNTADCNSVVTVLDTIHPTITCAEDGSRYINQNLTYEVSGTEFDPTFVNDNCGFTVTHDAGDIMDAVSTGDDSTLAGWQLPVGAHTVIFTVTDAANNIATCEVVIEVLEPILTGNAVITLNCAPRNLRIRVYEQNTTNLLFTYLRSTDNNGDFDATLTGLTPGDYDFYIKVEGYLQRKFENVNVSGGGPSIIVNALKPGDIAGGGAPNNNTGLNGSFNDNFINSTDLSLLIGHYNSQASVSNGTPSYNSRCDLNCDGVVDALDMSYLSFFFFQLGE